MFSSYPCGHPNKMFSHSLHKRCNKGVSVWLAIFWKIAHLNKVMEVICCRLKLDFQILDCLTLSLNDPFWGLETLFKPDIQIIFQFFKEFIFLIFFWRHLKTFFSIETLCSMTDPGKLKIQSQFIFNND